MNLQQFLSRPQEWAVDCQKSTTRVFIGKQANLFIVGSPSILEGSWRVPGARCQVLGVKRQVPGVMCEVPGARYKVSGARCQVAGARCQVPGVRC